METKIGETFKYEGKKLQVKEMAIGCKGCFFDGQCNECPKEKVGDCSEYSRSDHKNVIFVEVKYEQPQEQIEQPQELNICQSLKLCPEGMDLWSPLLGKVKLFSKNECFVTVIAEDESTWDINADGTMAYGDRISIEPMLYPSKEQRDWTTVKYEKKKELPRTWEEFCEQNELREWECFIDDCCDLKELIKVGGSRDKKLDRNLLPSKQAAEAHLALMQLHQLRDAWREGWLPDWTKDNQTKYAICSLDGEFSIRIRYTNRHFLAFQNEERADEFLACFIDLIRKAGDLI